MKLTTNNGELDLPIDFSFEVELNNPFFSDEGDATIPATIPATPNNLKVLDNIHRVDRANRFLKTVPATLMAGAIQKHGQLIIDVFGCRELRPVFSIQRKILERNIFFQGYRRLEQRHISISQISLACSYE